MPRSADDILVDLRQSGADAQRLQQEAAESHERACRLIREAREHPELSVERAGEEIGLPRRTAYEYAKAADEFDAARP